MAPPLNKMNLKANKNLKKKRKGWATAGNDRPVKIAAKAIASSPDEKVPEASFTAERPGPLTGMRGIWPQYARRIGLRLIQKGPLEGHQRRRNGGMGTWSACTSAIGLI
jgi:hypothetical protein